ncbi:SDR family oxidoreductase [Pelagicoccus sp. SDUM812003]|uniref:enoyl-ACP reductase FabI n=1 Tax=Pelagicoccus sp. SDUM812003 TaxID=3041267 RepID=UPI00280DB734|nr:SDR family oxidoreductase [Pelagicoccus sp. SDUM812003]MDQ8203178.1 SDR family oxidoreductase [Pelagicoccus sp. SDUM812003]
MGFLNLEGKNVLVMGVANRKSVAWFVAKTLEEEGAKVIYSVRSEARKESAAKLLKDRPVYVCDVENPDQVKRLATEIGRDFGAVHGIVHSIAFANYSEGFKPFHETKREDYLQATAISSFSIVEVANAFKPILDNKASVVAISISSLTITAANYGYMSPVKAALDSSIRYLAKSFSKDTEVRFNTVNPGTLKTSASAGIPGYLESYLYSEKLTYRKRALNTQEVANAVAFLISDRSSGMNGASMVLDAGMGLNYFDEEVVRLAMRPEEGNKDA